MKIKNKVKKSDEKFDAGEFVRIKKTNSDITPKKKLNKKRKLNKQLNVSHNEPDESMILDSTFNEDDNDNVVDTTTNEFETTVENIQDDDNVDEVNFPHFYTLDNKVICIIEPNTKFSFHGKLKIKVLYGAVKIYGSTLDKTNTIKPVKVYSTRGSSLVTIETTTSSSSSSKNSISEVWNALAEDNIDQHVANTLQKHVNNLTDDWSVLSIQTFENILTKFLSKHCTHRLFPKIEDPTNYTWFDKKRAEIFLQTNFYAENCRKLSINIDKTNEFIDRIYNRCKNNELIKIIITGGKNVGKSTTARCLVNKLLEITEAVVYMDLDCGQSEFTPSGCISLSIIKKPLFGSNFTHLQTPYHQIYVGSADVTRCITNYINGIEKLVKYLDDSSVLNKYPVVVNTMGFCKGIGSDIISYTIRSIKPSDVLQIISKKSKNNFDYNLTASTVNCQTFSWCNVKNFDLKYSEHQFHVLDTEAENHRGLSEGWNIEPHQQREISMLSYLSGIILSNNNKNIDKNINEIVPYEIPFSSVHVSLDRPLIPQILSVMNGNIVGLCGCDFDQDNVSIEAQENCDDYPKVLLRAVAPTCYGFGIIRGVDLENKKIYVNTPLAMSRLTHVNCLIGSMPVPSGLLQFNKPGLPYAGGECDLPTSRDPRRGYFRMRQNRNDA